MSRSTETEFQERYNRALNTLKQNFELRENILKQYPSYEDERKSAVEIHKSLVPHVVAANKRELNDFNRKFDKLEEEFKNKPASRKAKDKKMIEVYTS